MAGGKGLPPPRGFEPLKNKTTRKPSGFEWLGAKDYPLPGDSNLFLTKNTPLPGVFEWLGAKDSNLYKQIQSLLSCH